jgi:hypothetical protein
MKLVSSLFDLCTQPIVIKANPISGEGREKGQNGISAGRLIGEVVAYDLVGARWLPEFPGSKASAAGRGAAPAVQNGGYFARNPCATEQAHTKPALNRCERSPRAPLILLPNRDLGP